MAIRVVCRRPRGAAARVALRTHSKMREVNRWGEAVILAVNVRNGDARQFFIGHVVEATQVDAVHDSDGGLGAHAIGTHAAELAEVVLVLLRVEQVLRQFGLSTEQTKAFCPRDRGPEAGSPTDGAVAPIRALRQIEVGFKAHGATVTTATIGSLHSEFPSGKERVLCSPTL